MLHKQEYIFVLLFIITIILAGCNYQNDKTEPSAEEPIESPKIFTSYSTGEYDYQNFNSENAVNRIAEIENEYFNEAKNGFSKYYGTMWHKNTSIAYSDSSPSYFEKYIDNIAAKGLNTDSMHCTIYAMEGLKHGLSEAQMQKLDSLHTFIYRDHEYAGWSIAYILTKYFNWKAYLIISEASEEYKSCVKHFKQDKKYHVWKQPNIPLEAMFDFDNDKEAVDSLLAQNEFGWGFSNQGWHTWITRFTELKECNWAGSPSLQFDNTPLFLSRKFTAYYDYQSHIVVLPQQ